MKLKSEFTILETGERVLGKPSTVRDWHLWFAWYPVWLKDTDERIWLERVWRKITQDYPYNGFHGYGPEGWNIKTEYQRNRP